MNDSFECNPQAISHDKKPLKTAIGYIKDNQEKIYSSIPLLSYSDETKLSSLNIKNLVF